jgi:hypothetical protein
VPKYRWKQKRKRIRHPRLTINNNTANNSLGITGIGPINIDISSINVSSQLGGISFSEVNEDEIPREGFNVVSLDNYPENTIYISNGDHYYRIENVAVE